MDKQKQYVVFTFFKLVLIYSLMALFSLIISFSLSRLIQGTMLNNEFINIIFLFIFCKFIYSIFELLSNLITVKVNIVLKEKLIIMSTNSLLEAKVEWLEKQGTGNIIARIQNDIYSISETVARIFPDLVKRFLFITILTIYIYYVNTKIGNLVLMTLIIIFFCEIFGSKMTDKYFENLRKTESIRDAKYFDVLSHSDITKNYNSYETIDSLIQKLLINYRKSQTKAMFALSAYFSPLIIMSKLPLFLIILFSFQFINQGELDFGVLIQVYFLLEILIDEIFGLSNILVGIPDLKSNYERLKSIWNAPKTLNAEVLDTYPTALECIISVKGMTMKFDGADEFVLKNINIDINENEMVAIVGDSGCGKSTLLKSIANIYSDNENYKEKIIIMNKPLKNWGEDLYEYLKYIPQDPFIIDGTIKDNLFLKDNYHDELTSICLSDLEVNKYIIDKKSLSLGERQRIVVARNVLSRPKILLLDEATSAISSKDERMILNMLKTKLSSTTKIFVLHRMENIDLFDKILVMSNGEVSGFGSHADLLRTNKLYYSLFSSNSESKETNYEEI